MSARDKIKIPKESPVHVLSIGTKILQKDVMDQFLRSLGEVKTHYASKMSVALTSYKDINPNIIFCEQNFSEGNVIEFIHAIGGLTDSRAQYFILAVESLSDDLASLANEMGVDEILVKPFSTNNIREIVERYLDKKPTFDQDWIKRLAKGRDALEQNRFQEAEEEYTSCVKTFSDKPSVLMECSEFFLKRNSAKVALRISEKVLSLSPNNARALHVSGSALKKMGKYREALEKLEQANRISPLNSVRFTEIAETHDLLAEEAIQSALKDENESSSLILAKARHQLLRKDYAGVVNYLDAKRSFLSDPGKKEADVWIGCAKKLGGIK